MNISRTIFAEQFMQGAMIFVYGVLCTVGAFHGGMWAAGGIGLAIILLIGTTISDRAFPLPDKNFMRFVLITLGIIAALTLTSTYPVISWKAWVSLATIFVPLAFLTSSRIQKLVFDVHSYKWFPIVFLTGAVALGMELQSDGVLLHILKGDKALLSEYNRSTAFIILMAFPIMAGLWNSSRRWLIAPFIILLFYPACLTESRTTKLAFLIGLGVVMAAMYAPKLMRGALTMLILPLMTWPFVARWFMEYHLEWVRRIPTSWQARTEIWDYMSYRIAEKPWLGWGLNTAHKLDIANPHSMLYSYQLIPASHPHNVFTELWVELGIPGVLLGYAFAFYTLHKAYTLNTRLRPFALGAWMVALCTVLVGFDFWSDAMFAAFALTGFAFVGLSQRLNRFAAPIDGSRRTAYDPDYSKQIV